SPGRPRAARCAAKDPARVGGTETRGSWLGYVARCTARRRLAWSTNARRIRRSACVYDDPALTAAGGGERLDDARRRIPPRPIDARRVGAVGRGMKILSRALPMRDAALAGSSVSDCQNLLVARPLARCHTAAAAAGPRRARRAIHATYVPVLEVSDRHARA